MRYDIYSGVQRAKTKTRSLLSIMVAGGGEYCGCWSNAGNPNFCLKAS